MTDDTEVRKRERELLRSPSACMSRWCLSGRLKLKMSNPEKQEVETYRLYRERAGQESQQRKYSLLESHRLKIY